MKHLLAFVLACNVYIKFAEGALVKFFHEDGKIAIYTTDFDEECQPLPQFRAYSIKSEDCAMLFRDNHCKSSYKLKVLPEYLANTETDGKFGSIQKCNDLDGDRAVKKETNTYSELISRIRELEVDLAQTAENIRKANATIQGEIKRRDDLSEKVLHLVRELVQLF